MAHLTKLLGMMGKYKMDLASIVEDTERTRFHPQTDGQTDGRTDRWTDGRTMDKVKPVFPRFNFVALKDLLYVFTHQNIYIYLMDGKILQNHSTSSVTFNSLRLSAA